MNKIALITGANRGLGYEAARQLGQCGYHIILGVRTLSKGMAAAAQLKKEGINVIAIQLDVTNEASLKKAAEQIAQSYDHLDVLINNAGIGRNEDVQPSVTPQSIWQEVFTTNFFGLVACTQAFLPLLKKSPAGRIVNVSSIMGSISLAADEKNYEFSKWVGVGAGAYSASKAAVNMFTVHLARELKDTSVKVNTVHPGWVKTDMGGQEAPMEIPEGAKTLVDLATLPPDSAVTGQFIHMGQALAF